MPFRSGKQRRYLWANEPEIARDWTNKYGSRVRKVNGGIMNQIPFTMGYQLPDLWNQWQQHKTASNLMKEDPTTKDYHQLAAHDFMQRFPNTPNWAGKGLATGYQLASEFGKGILNPSKMSSFLSRALEESRLNREGIEGLTPEQQDRYDSFSKTFDPTLKSMYPTDRLASLRNIIGTKFSGSAQAATPDDIMTSRSAFQDDYNYDRARVGEDTSDLSGMAQIQTPTLKQPKAQYNFPESDPWGFRQMEDERATPRSPQKIGMLEAYRRRFYKPATRALQGYSIADLNRMNFLGGYYSGPAREARRFDKRGLNVLDRAAAGKKVGNVTQLLGKYGYKGGALGSGDISFTGKPIGDPNVGTGYSRTEPGWQHSSFRGGGLASLWPR
jgi:hypothetical protein